MVIIMVAAWPSRTFISRRYYLDLVGLLLATVSLLAVNVAAVSRLKSLYIDLTEEKLFTLSESTKRVLLSLDEPITIRLYFSHQIGDKTPYYSTYFNLVKGVLLQYVDFSDNKIDLKIIDPEPFSEAEDRAVAFGLQGVPVSEGGTLGYFGLAATNSVDTQEIVSFFNPEREPFLEYDLTRLIHSLAMTRRKTIGLLSTLPLDDQGGLSPERVLQHTEDRRWLVMEQIRALFTVQRLPVMLDTLPDPDDIDVLMIVQPKNLPEQTLYAIDQFVLKGGRVLLFIDPVAESSDYHSDYHLEQEASSFSGLHRLLEAWGVRFIPNKVAANIDAARRVNVGQGKYSITTDHVAWLSLGGDSLDKRDATTSSLEIINVSTSGIFDAMEGATTTISPLISTSLRSMRLSAAQFSSPLPDVMGLVRSFRSENQRLPLAVRVTGIASSAFTEGASAAWREYNNLTRKSTGKINIILIADTDLLTDDLWVQKQIFFGQKLMIPVADNGTFVLNALEDLSGAEALIGLRGRGRMERPFVLVETLRREAELRYRAREQALLQQIDAVQERMRALVQTRGDHNKPDILLIPQERKDLEHFRRDLLTARRELRAVKHALAQDIEHLEGWIKAINIAGIPLLLIFIIIIITINSKIKNIYFKIN